MNSLSVLDSNPFPWTPQWYIQLTLQNLYLNLYYCLIILCTKLNCFSSTWIPFEKSFQYIYFTNCNGHNNFTYLWDTVTFNYLYTMWNNQIQVIDLSVTSNIYHFIVLEIFIVLYTILKYSIIINHKNSIVLESIRSYSSYPAASLCPLTILSPFPSSSHSS